MIITRVLTADGKLLREYPDCYASTGGNCTHIWATSLANDRRPRTEDGDYVGGNPRSEDVNNGNWTACICGPAIIIEEHQDDSRPNGRDVGPSD